MDLAYVDKLAKDNTGVKFILVGQDLFVRTVYAKGMKWKDFKGSLGAFSGTNTENNGRNWVD